ncbi:hypothetical protein CEE45_12280 [Candidatus Heimdallarchaeota archaeon B3_Heim]|nr:MAG: hypothetical protein CEE45_12280 [Candidatus Heimdallarchaeota archaeon B3_Heim]
MQDPHRNIFFSYQGSRRDQTIQLENNITKALINTLEYSSPIVGRAFVQELGFVIDDQSLQYGLQRNPLSDRSLERNFQMKGLIGIVPEEYKHESPELLKDSLPSQPISSVPDAWIWQDNKLILAFENKIKGKLDKNQLNAHKSLLSRSVTYILKTWEELAKFFVKLIPKLDQGNHQEKVKDLFLIDQFIKYLEMNNLTPFYGFYQSDFDFIVGEDLEQKRMVKKRFKKFINELYQQLPSRYIRKLRYHYVGSLKEPHCWGTFANKPKHLRIDIPHFTFNLRHDGFYVGVNIEGTNAVKKLYNRLKIKQQKFEELIDSLPSQQKIKLYVYPREHIQVSLYYDRTPVIYDLSQSNGLTTIDVNNIIKMARQSIQPNQPKFRFYLCTHYSPSDYRLNDQEFIDHIKKDLDLFWPFYLFITQDHGQS